MRNLWAITDRVLPPLAKFASWYAQKASSWVSGVPVRIK
jgi:hypothetical protein